MIEALPKAQELWNKPEELIDLWDNLESKTRHEQLIVDTVGKVRSVADLGCGAGRYAKLLDCNEYIGFDSSVAMLAEADRLNPGKLFINVDIFNFQPSNEYDAIIMIDVAHHQTEPVEAILRILELWQANFYVFTLLVGGIREDLYNSTVVAFPEVLKIYDKYRTFTRIERFDDNNFAWVLLEVVK